MRTLAFGWMIQRASMVAAVIAYASLPLWRAAGGRVPVLAAMGFFVILASVMAVLAILNGSAREALVGRFSGITLLRAGQEQVIVAIASGGAIALYYCGLSPDHTALVVCAVFVAFSVDAYIKRRRIRVEGQTLSVRNYLGGRILEEHSYDIGRDGVVLDRRTGVLHLRSSGYCDDVHVSTLLRPAALLKAVDAALDSVSGRESSAATQQ